MKARDLALRGLDLAEPLVRALERVPPRPGGLVTLTWHRVDEEGSHPDRHPGLRSATPAAFAAQAAWLARHRPVVSGADVVAALRGEGTLPAGAVLLTFDDAADDLASHVWPTLRSLDLPGVAFVATGFADDDAPAFWWDRLWSALARTSQPSIASPVGRLELGAPPARASAFRVLRDHLKALPAASLSTTVDELVDALGGSAATRSVLGWPELARLAGEGLELAPHSRSHAMLDRLPVDELDGEVAGSWQDLRDRVPEAIALFAYPSGQHDPAVAAAVERAGLAGAFTTVRGHNRIPGTSPWHLRRVAIGGRTTLPALRSQLVPWAGPVLERAAGRR